MEKKSSKPKIFNIKKVINQKKWTKEEDEELIKLVKSHNGKKWKEIASNFHNKSPLQCFSRYKRIRPEIYKGSWKKEEDNLILSLIEKYGTSWSKISKIIKTRNGKQIRDRYINILSPNINKKKFSPEEDDLLLKLYNKYGPKWATIHTFFKNRTTDMIKNRFHSSLKKKYENGIININNEITININNDIKKSNKRKKNEKDDNSKLTLNRSFPSTEAFSINNIKESSTISKLSYQPNLSLNVNNEKDNRKNIELNGNSLFNNNELYEISFDEDEF